MVEKAVMRRAKFGSDSNNCNQGGSEEGDHRPSAEAAVFFGTLNLKKKKLWGHLHCVAKLKQVIRHSEKNNK